MAYHLSPISPGAAVSVQVAFADKILLNKTDLVSEAEKAEVISRIKVRTCLTACPAAFASQLLAPCSAASPAVLSGTGRGDARGDILGQGAKSNPVLSAGIKLPAAVPTAQILHGTEHNLDGFRVWVRD